MDLTLSVSGLSRVYWSASNCTGTSSMIRASFFDKSPKSLLASIFSFILPLSSWVLASRFSILPYSAKNFLAVFSPTPGNPGMLSTESPIMPKKSMTCSGSWTSNFCCTSGMPQISMPLPMRAGRYMNIFSDTNCAKSLSGVTM